LAQKAGVYWVQVTDSHGCTKTDSITIRFTDLYLSIIHDTTITPEKSVLLMPLTNGTVNWQYSNALSCQTCQNAIATPALTTTFYITSQKDGCRVNDSVNVTVLKEDYFYIPSAFTPNNDGTNDVFKPTTNSVSEYRMQLFNRWGQLIFQTNNTLEGWNGKFHNIVQPNGVYVYVINYKNDQGKKHVLKGSFLLIQ
jgi:gliding motility-associated-like protein